MKNLIRVQNIITEIEKSEKSEYKSLFHYLDNEEMVIETKWTSKTIAYISIIEIIGEVIGYLEGNTKIKVRDIE